MNANRITLRPAAGRVSFNVLAEHNAAVVCDFHIEGVEARGTRTDWGFSCGPIDLVDHHADQERFWQHVSSTNLAIVKVTQDGIARPDQQVVINHTDCDSVLSSAIIAGLLPPEQRYGAAAIAADHTGEENDIADLLQGLDFLKYRKVEVSLDALAALESGLPFPDIVADALAVRRAKREEAKKMVANGSFRMTDGIAWIECLKKIDGEFFPAMMEGVQYVVIGYPHDKEPGRTAIKCRLGTGAQDMSLQHLRIKEFDPNYGGRWNAGSNSRGGGTPMSTAQWVAELGRCVRKVER